MASIAHRVILFMALLGLALFIGACDKETDADVVTVKINGDHYFLELAADNDTRVRGLGGRDFIAEDGGMIFVFRQARVLEFVMRDCLVPIDIVFLDGSGRVTAMHAMEPEEPQRPGESDDQYNVRLKRYSSRFAAQFALEFKSGTLEKLGLERGDKVAIDAAALKKLAE